MFSVSHFYTRYSLLQLLSHAASMLAGIVVPSLFWIATQL